MKNLSTMHNAPKLTPWRRWNHFSFCLLEKVQRRRYAPYASRWWSTIDSWEKLVDKTALNKWICCWEWKRSEITCTYLTVHLLHELFNCTLPFSESVPFMNIFGNSKPMNLSYWVEEIDPVHFISIPLWKTCCPMIVSTTRISLRNIWEIVSCQ